MAKDIAGYYRKVARVNKLKNFGSDLVKVLIMFTFLLPFYWMLKTAVSPYIETVQMYPVWIPSRIDMTGFRNLFSEWSMWPYIWRTIFTTGCCMAIQYVTMIPAAYAFAKMKFKGSGILFTLVMVAFMLPGQVTFISSSIINPIL